MGGRGKEREGETREGGRIGEGRAERSTHWEEGCLQEEMEREQAPNVQS